MGGAMDLSAKLGKILSGGNFTQTVQSENLKSRNIRWDPTGNCLICG
jgi:hypothetical protein